MYGWSTSSTCGFYADAAARTGDTGTPIGKRDSTVLSAGGSNLISDGQKKISTWLQVGKSDRIHPHCSTKQKDYHYKPSTWPNQQPSQRPPRPQRLSLILSRLVTTRTTLWFVPEANRIPRSSKPPRLSLRTSRRLPRMATARNRTCWPIPTPQRPRLPSG